MRATIKFQNMAQVLEFEIKVKLFFIGIRKNNYIVDNHIMYYVGIFIYTITGWIK